jgi:hypothetical protein
MRIILAFVPLANPVAIAPGTDLIAPVTMAARNSLNLL